MQKWPDYIDPTIYERTCPAIVVESIKKQKLVKIEYICATEFHFILGQQKWLRGEHEVGEIVDVHWRPRYDRKFDYRYHAPMLADEAAEDAAKEWAANDEFYRKHGMYDVHSDESLEDSDE